MAKPRRVSAVGSHARLEGTTLESILGPDVASEEHERTGEADSQAALSTLRQQLEEAEAQLAQARETLHAEQAARATDQAAWASERQSLMQAADQAKVPAGGRGRRSKPLSDPYHGEIADIINTVQRASNIQLSEAAIGVVTSVQDTVQNAVGQSPSLFEVTNLALLWLGVTLDQREAEPLTRALAPYQGRLKPRSLGPALRALWRHLLGE